MPQLFPSSKELSKVDKLRKEVLKYWNETPDPIPGFVGDDIAKLGMVLIPSTVGRFGQLLSKNLETLSTKYPKFTKEAKEGLAFVKTRYPAFFSRVMKNVSDITETTSGSFNPRTSKMDIASRANALAEDLTPLEDQINTIMHEFRHVPQFKISRYPRNLNQLGPYPYDKANEILDRMQIAYSFSNPKEVTRLQKLYQNIPHELDPNRAGNLGVNSLRRLRSLESGVPYQTPVELTSTFKPDIPLKSKKIENWNDLFNYFGVKK